MKEKIVVTVAVALIVIAIDLLSRAWNTDDNTTILEKAALFENQIVLYDSVKSVTAPNLFTQDNKICDEHIFLDHWTLIYFAYSNCIDVCAYHLFYLNEIKQKLQEVDKVAGSALQVVMVTIDPEHDTPGILKRTLSFYNKHFIGLTGDLNEIKKLAKILHVTFIQDRDQPKGYMQHNNNISVINPDGNFQGFIRPFTDVWDVVNGLSLINDMY